MNSIADAAIRGSALNFIRLINLALLAATTAACGGSSTSSAPSPIPTPTPSTVTISGRLTAANGGQALAGVQATLGSIALVTAADGAFSAQAPPSASMQLRLAGDAIVPRTLMVAAASTRAVAVNAIALAGGFDLAFYRQLVRDATESAQLQPVQRWTRSPNLFIQTTDLVDARTLDMVEATARQIVPVWTSGQFSVASVERGPGSRQNQSGWISVVWSADTPHCGDSSVGIEGGVITLYPKRPTCGVCDGYPIAAVTVRHELGHALGFYHTDDKSDLMFPSGNACNAQPSPRELYHAAIAYQRPVGNTDPDNDPSSVVNLTPRRVP